MRQILTLIVSVAILLASAIARAEIGTIQFALGDVRIIDARGSRAATKGDQINEGDSLAVGATGSAQIKMVDGGFIAVRPDTQMKFDQYKWSGKEDGTERGLLSLVRGGFRTITGGIGRVNKQNLTVSTPTATVGIRGTDHEVLYVPEGTVTLIPQSVIIAQAGAQTDVAPLLIGRPETLVPMLLAQAGPGPGPGGGRLGAPPGTFNKVNVGLTRLTSAGISIIVRPNQVGHAPLNQAPRLLPAMPSFMRTATPPRPVQQQTAQGQGQGQGQGQQGQQGEGQQGGQQGQQAQGGGQGGQQGGQQQASAEPIRSSAVVDNPGQIATASATATEAAVVSPVATTTVVAITPVSTQGGGSSTTTTTNTTVGATVVTLQSSAGETVNLTTNTKTDSTGVVVPIAQELVLTSANNPLWINATTDTPRGSHFLSGSLAAGGGFRALNTHGHQPGHNVSYLMDDNKNLVTLRNSADVTALGLTGAKSDLPGGGIFETNTTISTFSDASVTISGATAGTEGVFVSPDKSAFMGRLMGGQLDFNHGSLIVPLGAGGVVWGTVLEPPLPGISRLMAGPLAENTYVHFPQQLTGSMSFSKVYSTTPFDGAGNLGSVTSASLSANFNAQTVDASVGVAFTGARNLNISGSVTGVPLTQSGFDAFAGTVNAPTITCSTTGANGCASGYVGNISGAFAGASTITGAGLGYAFKSNNPTGPYTDVITGAVAFAANGAPAVGQNLSFASNANVRHSVFYPVIATDGTVYSASLSNGTGVSSPNTNYLFDGAGNLVRVQETPYTLFLSNSTVSPATVPVPASTNNAVNHPVELSLSGTPAEMFDATALIGARFGRYQGGKVTVQDLANDQTYFDNLGAMSALWAVQRAVPSALLVAPGAGALTGMWHYTRIADSSGNPGFATAATDTYGNVGSLLGARLEVDFNTMTVNPGLRVGFANTGPGGTGGAITVGASAEDVPIVNGGFNVASSDTNPLRVSCAGAGCTPAYTGRVVGNFTSVSANGSTADGALMRYSFGNTSAQQFSGLVALGQGPQIVAPTNPNLTVATSYYYWSSALRTFGTDDFLQGQSYDNVQSTVTFAGPGGNLSAVSDNDKNVTINVGTQASSSVTAALANGIQWGQYGSGSTGSNPTGSPLTITGNEFNGGAFTNRAIVGVYQWISGPNVWPIFSSSVVPGNATYTKVGNSLPTSQNGVTGVLNSASLFVNFDRQFVNASVDFNLTGNHWVASASQVRLDDGGGFMASAGSSQTYAHNNMTVNINGSPIGFGQMQGSLTGAMMNGATLAYTLAGNPSGVHEHANGVVAFGSPNFSANTATSPVNALELYRIKLAARGTVSGFDASTGAISTATPAASIDSEYMTLTRISAIDAQRTKFNSNNELIEFDARGTTVSVNGSCPSQCFTNDLPSRIGIVAAGSGASGAIPAMPAISGTAATVVESGIDAATGLRWGRYDNGNFAVVDRVTGLPVGAGSFQLGPINHYLVSSEQSGPTVLPVSGTFNYTMIGKTSPTDTANNVGVLNSASLSANFTAKTVDTAINATVGGRTWTASAAGVPIIAGVGFEAKKSLSGSGSLAVNCGGCTAPQLAAGTAGRITGAFMGPTGTAAGIAYSLNAGGLPPGLGGIGVTMGGVAAFKR